MELKEIDKEIQRVTSKVHRLENLEQYREKQRKWRKTHWDKIKQYREKSKKTEKINKEKRLSERIRLNEEKFERGLIGK